MPQTATRNTRLEARISRDGLALVRRAAEIEGRSISDFVVAAAQDAARRTIADVEVIRLSRRAQEKFAELLLNPSHGLGVQFRGSFRESASLFM